jgi:hypothetical protein
LGIGAIEDDWLVRADAAQLEHMMDHEHEGFERRLSGVDQAQAEEIEMGRAGNMALGVVLGAPRVDETETGRAELGLQFGRVGEQSLARVWLFHGFPITLVEKALQSCTGKESEIQFFSGCRFCSL